MFNINDTVYTATTDGIEEYTITNLTKKFCKLSTKKREKPVEREFATLCSDTKASITVATDRLCKNRHEALLKWKALQSA